MKNIMTKTAALLSGILMFLAIVSTGPNLAEAVLDGTIKRGQTVEAGMSKKEIKFIPKTTN